MPEIQKATLTAHHREENRKGDLTLLRQASSCSHIPGFPHHQNDVIVPFNSLKPVSATCAQPCHACGSIYTSSIGFLTHLALSIAIRIYPPRQEVL